MNGRWTLGSSELWGWYTVTGMVYLPRLSNEIPCDFFLQKFSIQALRSHGKWGGGVQQEEGVLLQEESGCSELRSWRLMHAVLMHDSLMVWLWPLKDGSQPMDSRGNRVCSLGGAWLGPQPWPQAPFAAPEYTFPREMCSPWKNGYSATHPGAGWLMRSPQLF